MEHHNEINASVSEWKRAYMYSTCMSVCIDVCCIEYGLIERKDKR